MKTLLLIGLLFVCAFTAQADDLVVGKDIGDAKIALPLTERIDAKIVLVDKTKSDTVQKEAVATIVKEEVAVDVSEFHATTLSMQEEVFTADKVVGYLSSFVDGKVKVVPIYKKRLFWEN